MIRGFLADKGRLIYGMNFEHMPELAWMLGYPFAIVLMILSAILPYLFFKSRGWRRAMSARLRGHLDRWVGRETSIRICQHPCPLI